MLPRQGFGRALAIVGGGAALGQVLTIVASPLLSRLYSPGDFGELAIYLSLSASIAMVAGLTYQLAIPLPDDDADAASVAGLSAVLVLVVAALTTVALVAGAGWLRTWPRTASITGWIWLVPIGVVGIGLFEVASQWAIRTKQFGPIARTSAGKGVAQVAVQTGWGAVAGGPLGLVAGQLVGQWAGMFSLARIAWRGHGATFRKITFRNMVTAARRQRRFPLLTLPAVVLNAVSNYAPPLVIAYFFGGAVAGLYAFQDRVTMIPIRFVGASAQRVFMSSAADANREQRLAPFTFQVFRQLVVLTTPLLAILAACAPHAFGLIFGAEWREAGVYAQWLCLRTALTTIVFPLTPLVYVLEKQWAETCFQVLLLIGRVGPIVLGGLLGSARLAIMLCGIGVGFAWLVYLLYLLRLSGNGVRPVLRLVLIEIAIAAGFALPLAFASYLDLRDVWITLAAAVLGALALVVVWRRSKGFGAIGIGSAGPKPADPQPS